MKTENRDQEVDRAAAALTEQALFVLHAENELRSIRLWLLFGVAVFLLGPSLACLCGAPWWVLLISLSACPIWCGVTGATERELRHRIDFERARLVELFSLVSRFEDHLTKLPYEERYDLRWRLARARPLTGGPRIWQRALKLGHEHD